MASFDRQEMEALFRDRGLGDFRWLPPAGIVVARWVRMKCQFGCPEYGTSVACPPSAPPVEECERFFREYSEAAIFRFPHVAPDREERRRWSREVNTRLVALERDVFLLGFPRAFMLPMGGCPKCEECVSRPEDCRHPGSARPTPEALAVDVFSTARGVGYPIEVLTDLSESMNRYAILLIE